jgi:hypothetical protein
MHLPPTRTDVGIRQKPSLETAGQIQVVLQRLLLLRREVAEAVFEEWVSLEIRFVHELPADEASPELVSIESREGRIHHAEKANETLIVFFRRERIAKPRPAFHQLPVQRLLSGDLHDALPFPNASSCPKCFHSAGTPTSMITALRKPSAELQPVPRDTECAAALP